MATEPIKVEGLRELASTLRKLAKEFPKEIREINLRRAKAVAARSGGQAPRLSGRLAGSIKPLATQRNARVTVGRGVPYGEVIYWGWPGHSIAPNPFIDRTLDQMRSTIEREFETELNAFVQEVWSQWG